MKKLLVWGSGSLILGVAQENSQSEAIYVLDTSELTKASADSNIAGVIRIDRAMAMKSLDFSVFGLILVEITSLTSLDYELLDFLHNNYGKSILYVRQMNPIVRWTRNRLPNFWKTARPGQISSLSTLGYTLVPSALYSIGKVVNGLNAPTNLLNPV